jgi:uncharacterized protein YbaA (DUF1428 family)
MGVTQRTASIQAAARVERHVQARRIVCPNTASTPDGTHTRMTDATRHEAHNTVCVGWVLEAESACAQAKKIAGDRLARRVASSIHAIRLACAKGAYQTIALGRNWVAGVPDLLPNIICPEETVRYFRIGLFYLIEKVDQNTM